MSNHIALSRWDAAIAAYLSSRHALGRAYAKEELVLRHLRAFLARRGAHDLDQPLFDQWRRQFSHLSASTRIIREISVYNFCRYRRRAHAARSSTRIPTSQRPFCAEPAGGRIRGWRFRRA